MSKLHWKKNMKGALPVVHGMKAKPMRSTSEAKLNYVNPLYYIQRIKNQFGKKKYATPI